MSWWTRLLHVFGHTPVAKTPEHVSDPREKHSEELRKRADRTLDDLKAVRRIEIIVRRR